MYTIGIFLAVATIIAFTIGKPKEKEFRPFAYVLWPVLGLFIGTFTSTCLGKFLPERKFSHEPVQLVAMHTTDSLNGAFVLGSGSITNETRYTFMQRDIDGSFVQKSLAVNDTVHIVEDPSLHNVGYWTTTYTRPYKPTGFNIWTFALNVRPKAVSREEFRVPVGTVLQQFNVK